MNTRRILPFLLLMSSFTQLFSQNSFYIPTGPDWKGTDLNGQTHQLYDYLNQGKIVFLDVFSTWCGPCYSYQQSGKFKELYNQYGPNGANTVRVFALEADPGTGIPQLYGTPPLTQGNFVAGTPYPIIDLPRIDEAFYVDGYPSLYCVCPDRTTYSLSHNWSAAQLYEEALDSCTQMNFLRTRIDTVMPQRCKSDNNGEIRMSVLSGVAPYTFHWNNGDTTQHLSGLPGGHYVCTITDAMGKVGKASAYVPKPQDSLILNLSVEHLNCTWPGENNGLLSAYASGGITPYSVKWSTGVSAYTIENLSAGFYDMTLTDAYGCSITRDSIELRPKYQPVAMLAPVTPINCLQSSSVLNGAGSTLFPFDSIIWRKPDGTWVPSQSLTFTATTPGQYRLLLSNFSSGCFSSAYASINLDTIRPMAEAGPAKNQNCSGTPITLQGSGSGSGPLSYIWSSATGTILSGGNTAVPTVSGAGTYTLTVTRNLSGCTRSDATTVTVLNQTPTVQAYATVINCNNPSATLSATSSVPNSTFKWTGPGNFSSTLNPATATQPGTYTLTTTGSGGCSTTSTVTVVADLAPPQVVILPPQTITCNQPGVTLTATATPAGASFSWTGPNVFSAIGPQPTVHYGGVYTVVAGLPNGCTASSSVTVLTDQAMPQLTVLTPDVLSCNTQSVDLHAQSLTADATFNWSGPNGFSAIGSQTSASQPGAYTVVATAPNGCTSSSTVAVNADQSTPVISIESPGILTCAQTSVVLSAATSGNGPFVWFWSTTNGHILSGTDSPNPVVNAPGNYQVQLTNVATGCSSIATIQVQSAAPPQVQATQVQAASCPDATDGVASVSVSQGTPPFNYLWSNGQTNQQATELAPGTALVTVSDAAGCSVQIQLEISWVDDVAPTLQCPANQTVSYCQNSVAYELPSATDNCTINQPLALLEGLSSGQVFPEGTTTIVYQATDAGANQASCSFTVYVAPELHLSADIQADMPGAVEGAIDLSLSGGLPPYLFAWTNNGQPFTNSEDLFSAPAGEYQVSITDAGGCTLVATYLVPLLSATDDLQSKLGIQLSPNPASDRIWIKTSTGQSSNLRLALYDARGVVMSEWSSVPDYLDVSKYPNGVYLLQGRSTNGLFMGASKLVIER
ncbi:MAG: HYR domain-containing protein [Saprospiraceae bacterium]|nr:HYR domain-containing protein [Saprospiraceae bacterium]